MKSLFVILIFITTTSLYAQQSFTLSEAIAYALEQSNDIRVADLDHAKAKAQLTEYKSIGLPRVTGGIDYNQYFYIPVTPIPDFITPLTFQAIDELVPTAVVPELDPSTIEFTFFTKHNLSATVDATMLLFDGSYLTGLKASKLFIELSSKQRAVKEEERRAKVTKAYMNILIAEENKKTLEKNITTINKSLKEAKAFYENGFIENLDVQRIELSLNSVTTELEKIDYLIELSHDLLKYQMSYPINKQISITEDLETLVDRFNTDTMDTENEIDFNKKAQYTEILMGKELNDLNVKRLKQGYLPSLRARAGVSESLQRNNLFDGDESGWLPSVFAGLALNVPIYDGKMKKGQIQQAQIEAERIDIQKMEFERAVTLQVRSAQNKFLSAKSNLENNKNSLSTIQSIYDSTLIKFREGVGSSVEVTQAETQLFQAQANYINALYDLLITKTDLDIALGDL